MVDVLKNLPHLPQTLTICTDDVFPEDLVNDGAMSSVLRRLIAYGLKPVDDMTGLSQAIRVLMGCPFVNGLRARR